MIGLFLGGYDSAPQQGPQFSALVEGQLFHRVALRVAVDYQDGIHNVYPSVGVRVGLLRQERFKVDLGRLRAVQEPRLLRGIGRVRARRARSGAAGASSERSSTRSTARGSTPASATPRCARRSCGTRIARLQAGLDLRARINLGDENAARTKAKLEADFDFLGGLIGQLTVVQHLVLMAEVGPHVVVIKEQTSAGVVALAGVGATY